jgi:epoxyqueuosine reductase
MQTSTLKEKAYELGIDMVGIVAAEDIDRYAGLPVTWQNSKLKKTTDYLENAKSVIVLGFGIWDDVFDLTVHKDSRWTYPGEMVLSVRQRDMALALQREGLQVYAGYPLISHKYLAQLGGLGAMGKNSMIVTREFGTRVRFRCIITDAVLEYDQPFTEDLCGSCTECIKACPVGALTEYVVDQKGCMVGRHIKEEYVKPNILAKYEPQVTTHSHLMCRECQKACPY